MKKYENLTATEVLKLVNDVNKNHEELKTKALQTLGEIENLQEILNDLTEKIENLEIEYVELMEALIEKQNNG